MPEERIKFALRIPKELQEEVKRNYAADNCASQNEYMEKAIHFYNGYINTKNSSRFLSRSLHSTISGLLGDSDNQLKRAMFRLAVEVSMMMNIIAITHDLDDHDLREIRIKSVADVKRTYGTLRMEDLAEHFRGPLDLK